MSDQMTSEGPGSAVGNSGGRVRKVPAPGARRAPQIPGQGPDPSTVPGFHSLIVPAATSVMRPLTEYQTAQEISKRFRKYPADQITPEQFEQADASFEELRKANPADNPPVRPKRGYILDAGEEAAALPEKVEEQAGEF